MKDSIMSKYLNKDMKYRMLAETSLDIMARVASAARAFLFGSPIEMNQVLAAPQRPTEKTQQIISPSQRRLSVNADKVTREPILVKVVVNFEGTDDIKEFYTCYDRPVGLKNLNNVLSRNAPLAHFATYDVGTYYKFDEEDFSYIPPSYEKFRGKYFSVIQKSKFRKHKFDGQNFDCERIDYSDDQESNVLLRSLRKYIGKDFDDVLISKTDDMLSRVEQDKKNQEEFWEKRIDDVINSFQLRTQHTLDRYQDIVSRIPLDSRVFLLGPAGSGKTTTLIHRLRIKLDEDNLSEDEKKLIGDVTNEYNQHLISWIMFTPQKMLSLYVKEAFNKEGIAVPGANIKTWDEYSVEIGKRFKLLRQPTSSGGLKYLKNGFNIINNDLIFIFTDFKMWLIDSYKKSVRESLDNCILYVENDLELNLFSEIEKIFNRFLLNGDLAGFWAELINHKQQLNSISEKSKKIIYDITDSSLMKNRDNKLLIKELENYIEDKEGSGEFEDNDIEFVVSDEDIAKIRRIYRLAIIAYARAFCQTEKIKGKRNKRILELLKENTLPKKTELDILRKNVEFSSSLLILNNPIKFYFSSILRKYKIYRELHQGFYRDGIDFSYLDKNELDILILTHLDFTRDLFVRRDIYLKIGSESWLGILKERSNIYRNQVFVDEAPDFSPITLKCMFLLTHPHINSFFACGDFNQRMRSMGTKDFEILEKFIGNIKKYEISVAYRQSKYLFEFSQALAFLINKGNTQEKSASLGFNLTGFSPALKEYAVGEQLIGWLCERIVEIEKKMKGNIPSIALLVPSESYVEPIAQDLESSLSDFGTTIRVEACYHGQSFGTDNAIRVVDVQYIKGLEFEVVFFISFDKMAEIYSKIIDNILYVGATRAASFFGVTCEGKAIGRLEELRGYFKNKFTEI